MSYFIHNTDFSMVSHILSPSGDIPQDSLGSPSLSSLQDSPHSLKIKQEPYQLSPSLPALHQASVWLSRLQLHYVILRSRSVTSIGCLSSDNIRCAIASKMTHCPGLVPDSYTEKFNCDNN
ncbi:hypothetical protein G9C98_000535 [Cotesia typhae]|uniref:Uncharacterized protein n=1 Tax=Cotesia typhae TaxID=2053667 RepID=A0A8J5QV08_9HYME|nr:hypothetical protein G9C98_000535 [Cotesia typhae]